ncbi:hypothetical protein VMCG_05874 [Cytospora schulzeri]|uniref:Heterokaryon incompatibility domain-containing protein n=1 Tax=Cytospora schulzeri TaxID=448051 RepID=A0A423WCZ9_9PEZI|nr:hypothetical protein VMCG_05874 [Valsa malicola]
MRQSPKGNFDFQKRLEVSNYRRAIRVLTIHPGSRGTGICASAHLLDLDNSSGRSYRTLSYTWGDAYFPKSIIVDGEVVNTTLNLHNSLQYIRSRDVPIDIWIDAICINQEQIQERSSQVNFMDEIYSRCEQVYIWLGCPIEPQIDESSSIIPTVTHNPFALVEHFRDDKHFFELPGYHRDSVTGKWTCDVDNPEFKSLWDDAQPIATSPWWTRAWTAQETILPPHALVMFGDWSLPWFDLVAFRYNRSRHLNDYSGACCGQAHEAIGWKRMYPLDYISGPIMRMDCLRQRIGYIQSFSDVSRAFADRHCADPRDKIYSILSFASARSGAVKVRPDYQKSLRDVFVEAFVVMLMETDMNPSCLLGQGFNSLEIPDLPSWVRNFSLPMETGYQLRRAFEEYPLYNTCGPWQGQLTLVSDNVLQLRGLQVDSIKAKSRAVYSDWNSSLKETLSDWRHVCENNGVEVTVDKLDFVMARVLCREVIDAREAGKGSWRLVGNNDSDLPNDAQWEAFMKGNARALPRKYRIGVGTGMDSQVLFVTANGRVGLGHPGLEICDTVWVVGGARAPFIFRETGQKDSYRLVGDAYVYGIMHGECLSEKTMASSVLLA